jgi:hypothetical protein
MFDSANLFVITTTLANKNISEKRRNNILNEFSKYNIPVIFNHGIDKSNASNLIEIGYKIILKGLQTFKKIDCTYALICEDDFFPIPNFLEELNKTGQQLPENWRCLHLCPGYLWGRRFRDNSKFGQLNPEENIDMLEKDASGRLFINCDPKTYCNKAIWLGGPIAFIVNKKSIDDFIDKYTKVYAADNIYSDRILTRMLSPDDFICRSPMLGNEREEGGTSF